MLPPFIAPIVKLTEVSKLYERGDDRICGLDRVTLEVTAGAFCAVVGPSGCGKSTLLNLIAGLDLPTSGDIQLNGQSTAHYNADDWTRVRRQCIGIVFQAFHLVPGLTVEENVAFPLLLRGDERRGVAARVSEVLALVPLNQRARHRPRQLPGRQQPRVAVATAMLRQHRDVQADGPP